MLPNLIWVFVPAPNDVLRGESITQMLDTVASVSQIILVTALCMVVNTKSGKVKIKSKFSILCAVCCAAYFIAWALHYQGLVNASILLSLCLFPCFAFLAYETDRKNIIALLPTVAFYRLSFGIYTN